MIYSSVKDDTQVSLRCVWNVLFARIIKHAKLLGVISAIHRDVRESWVRFTDYTELWEQNAVFRWQKTEDSSGKGV